MAELFYDTIKDFPELTFGATAIPSTGGRFHVVLDSVLVFKKVSPEAVAAAASLVQSSGPCIVRLWVQVLLLPLVS